MGFRASLAILALLAAAACGNTTATPSPPAAPTPSVSASAPAPAPSPPTSATPAPPPTDDPCIAPGVTCATSDIAGQLKITKPGVYDGQHHTVRNILIHASGVTVRNWVVSGGVQAGIWSEGANNTIADNDISQIGYGTDDLDAMRFFGDGTQILDNTVHNLIRGPLKDAHPDCVQTYAHSSPGSSHVLIQGNHCLGLDFHQCVMAEGPSSTDGGGGGGGVSEDWQIVGNVCEGTSAQAIALRGISQVLIEGNTFRGNDHKAIQSVDGSSNIVTIDNILGPAVQALIGD